MRYSFSIFLLILLLTCTFSYDFDDYVKQFEKKYENETQLQFRKQIFTQNYTKILQNNQNPDNIPMSPTKWTDRTSSQISHILNFKVNSSHSPDPYPTSNLRVSAALSVDWRLQDKVTNIKDQGNCGACWAFTTTGCLQSYLAIKNKTKYDLSEQALLQCTPGSSCEGGILGDGMERARDFGLPLESKYPYTAGNAIGNDFKQYPKLCTVKTTKRVSMATRVYTWTGMSAEQVRERLAESPLAIAIYANDAFTNFRSSTVFSCRRPVYHWQLNHGVLLIGYDTNGNYIIKNSWGTKWGNNGFALLDRTYHCGVGLLVAQFSQLRVSATKSVESLVGRETGSGEVKVVGGFAGKMVVGFVVMLVVVVMVGC